LQVLDEEVEGDERRGRHPDRRQEPHSAPPCDALFSNVFSYLHAGKNLHVDGVDQKNVEGQDLRCTAMVGGLFTASRSGLHSKVLHL